jgi:hypothetical protein
MSSAIYHGENKLLFDEMMMKPDFVLDQHTELYFYSVRSMQKQSACQILIRNDMTKIHKHDYGIVHVKFNTINVIISMFSSIAEDHGSFSSCVKQKTIK